jgi:nucleotide-binding universal stress UspA family protein
MTLGPLLVPLDFSDCAPLLLDEAVRFARAFGAPLLLLHVTEPPRGLPLTAVIEPPGDEPRMTVAEALRRDVAAHVAPLVSSVETAGVTVTLRTEFGPIAERILSVAHDAKASMIIMATHGRSGLVRLTLGSIAETVLRKSDVPVVTVRTQHRPTCSASSCATCTADHTALDRALRAESTG